VSGWDWSKIGTAGAAAVAVLVAVITEDRIDGETAAALWSVGMILAGVALTQIVVDWWRSSRDE
jgi:hypothetical protein